MGQRNFSLDGIVLRSREIPSGGRVVSLLTAEDGVIDTFMFGGSKSKLRSLASPWHEGRAWLYRDAQKDFTRLSDFDALIEFPSIRTNLEALSVAGFVSEFITETSALGGEGAAAFALVHDTFLALESMLASKAGTVPPAAHLPVLVQFCLRALSFLGMLPDTDSCCLCAGIITPDTIHSYARLHSGFVCAACRADAETGDSFVNIPPGAVVWLQKTLGLPFMQASRIGLAAESLRALEACTLDIVRQAIDSPLKTLGQLERLR